MRKQNGHNLPKLNMFKKEGVIRDTFTLLRMENIGKRKNLQLEQEEGTIVGQENLKNFISEYYKKLFAAPVTNFFALDEQMIHDMPQISQEENAILTQEFTEKEVWDAIK